jgi:hypothetical protein
MSRETETELYPRILTALSRGGTRLFRQQVALSWMGQIVARTPDTITLLHPRALKVGAPGISDFAGIHAIEVTEDLLGARVGVYVAIEAKGPRGRVTPEQRNFLAMIQSLGGRAGIARSVAEASDVIAGETASIYPAP